MRQINSQKPSHSFFFRESFWLIHLPFFQPNEDPLRGTLWKAVRCSFFTFYTQIVKLPTRIHWKSHPQKSMCCWKTDSYLHIFLTTLRNAKMYKKRKHRWSLYLFVTLTTRFQIFVFLLFCHLSRLDFRLPPSTSK